MADSEYEAYSKNKGLPEDLLHQVSIVNETYSYINNIGFYAAVNPTYYDYYYRVVRKCSQWLDGYVMNFHNTTRGYFSTRLASALVNGIGNHVVGQKIYFEKMNEHTEKEDIDFITDWSKNSKFQDSVRNAIKTSIALGTSLLKLNKSNGILWCQDVRLDYFFFEEDSMGKLTDVTIMIKGYSNVNHSESAEKQNNYYLVEHRYFKDVLEPRYTKTENGYKWHNSKVGRKPMVEYNVYEYKGNAMSAQEFRPSGGGKMTFKSLPSKVRNSLRDNFGIRELDVPQELPFNDYLGCELLKNDEKDITLPNTPFGKPMLLDIITYLISYDMTYSYMMRDIYLGKGSVIVPKGMIAPGQLEGVDSPFNGNDSAYFEQYSCGNPDNQKPVPVQFNLRIDEWEKELDNILRKIATTIGMSPKTIASYLEQQGQSERKTATEVNAEDDATISYISIKRSIFEAPLNRIINTVMEFYKRNGKITAKFSTPSLVNMDKIVDRVVKLKQMNLLSDKMALKMLYPDDDNDEIEAKLKELEEFNAKKLKEETKNTEIPNEKGDYKEEEKVEEPEKDSQEEPKN